MSMSTRTLRNCFQVPSKFFRSARMNSLKAEPNTIATFSVKKLGGTLWAWTIANSIFTNNYCVTIYFVIMMLTYMSRDIINF